MILVVDHYDSFVYNLVQLVGALGRSARAGPGVQVVRSDAAPGPDLAAARPDAVVLSPGPGRPEDAGCMVDLIRALDPRTPLLGVCLGHQALAVALGASVVRAPAPVHGKASPIHHDGGGILAGLPRPFRAGRYHSLVVRPAGLPPELAVTAWTEDGLIMGLRHRERPWYGVQFHPESILTPEGPRIVRNFLSLVGARSPARTGGPGGARRAFTPGSQPR